MPADFESSNYREPYVHFKELLSKSDLSIDSVIQEISNYEKIDLPHNSEKYNKMRIYWKSVRFICDIYKENLQNGEAVPSTSIDQHGLAPELVEEADRILES